AFENAGHGGVSVWRLASLLARRVEQAPAVLHRDGGSRHRPCRTIARPNTKDDKKSAAGKRPAALEEARLCEILWLDRVGALSVLALGGGDGQPHFLSKCTGSRHRSLVCV